MVTTKKKSASNKSVPAKVKKPSVAVAKRTTKPVTQRTKTVTTAKKNPFEGATRITETNSRIIVERKVGESGKGKVVREKKEYFDKTPANIQDAQAVISKRVKKISYEL